MLVGIALTADVLGILGFLGLAPERPIRVGVTVGLGALGVIMALSYLWSALKVWLSPKGAYYPSAIHRGRTLIAVVALVVAGVLAIAGIYLAAHPESDAKSKQESSQASPVSV